MHSLLKSKKAQFFILSAFAIITILYLISRWIEPYTIIDTSSVVFQEAPFIFNNIKEKIAATVIGSKSCEDVRFNLEEYKNFIKSYALEKGYDLELNYTIASCPEEPPPSPTVVALNLSIKSPSIFLLSQFSCGWPIGCPI